MPGPTWLDCARLCSAVYERDGERVTGGWRRAWFGVVGDGFKGGQFQRSSGERASSSVPMPAPTASKTCLPISASAGFQPDRGGDDPVLAAADPGRRRIARAGEPAHFALALMRQARWAAGQQGASLTLAGHSLGGGLSAPSAADTGEAAATISSPAVAEMPGVLACCRRNGPRIVNLELDGVPIKATPVLGNRLGTTRTIRTSRMAGSGHGIDGTVTDLSPGGVSSSVGAQIPR